MSEQPYAFVAEPWWHRDEPVVVPSLADLAAACDEATFQGPDSFRVYALFKDGRRELVPADEYSEEAPASRAEAEAFVDDRAARIAAAPDPASTMLRAFGVGRCDPDAPREKQISDYIASSPSVWRTVA